MKAVTHTHSRLVLKHVPVGFAVIMALLVLLGVAAGVASISMHERLVLTDDFIRIGVALILGTFILGGLVIWKAVRVRQLIFDGDAAVLRFETRGLGRPQRTTWPLASLVRAEISTIYISGSGHRHSTKLVFADEQTKNFGSMDLPTHAQIANNVETINAWLAQYAQRDPMPSP